MDQDGGRKCSCGVIPRVLLVLTEGLEQIKKTVSLRTDSSCLQSTGHQLSLYLEGCLLFPAPPSAHSHTLYYSVQGQFTQTKKAHCCKNSFPGEIHTASMFLYGPSYKEKQDSTRIQPREPMSLLVRLTQQGWKTTSRSMGKPKEAAACSLDGHLPIATQLESPLIRFPKLLLLPLRALEATCNQSRIAFKWLGGVTDSPVRVQDPLHSLPL